MPNPDPVTDQPGRTGSPWTADKHAGRETELRPDWEQVTFDVMLRGLRASSGSSPSAPACC